jgi:glycosyltransferase involved in cell wall biosynthesis
VENRNVLKLAGALLTMMDDKDLRKKSGEIAKIKSANFSKSKIMTQWIDLFEYLTHHN